MSQNQAPIFPLTPVNSWPAAITTAITTVNGDLSGSALIYTANGTNGSRLDYIRIRPLGTNVATVLRVFLNNGSTAVTAGNNVLITEVTIAASTVSQVAALAETTLQLDLVMAPGYRVYVTIGTTISAGVAVTACGGDY